MLVVDKNNMNVEYFKNAINQESVINLNFNYLTKRIEDWWEYVTDLTPGHLAKFQLIHLLLKYARKEHLNYFDKLGTPGVSAVSIENIFNFDCPRLSIVVHEAISELFALNDIKYPYEEHKKLYLKPDGLGYKNWGNGFGEITPHSDDLYEDLDVDFLSLTVCRDHTNTPTKFYFPKDILNNFTDSELRRLFKMKVKFLSGKNVTSSKSRERNVVEYLGVSGFNFFLDFRVDNDVGARMRPVNEIDEDLIRKMRKNIETCPCEYSVSKTGTFLIVANYKVLHARGQMQMDAETAKKMAMRVDYSSSPRLLYRSKGQDSKLMNIL